MTAGAAEKVDGVVVVELDAAGIADEVEDDVSFGSTNPEVWAVAPAATGSMIWLLIGLLIIIDDSKVDDIELIRGQSVIYIG